MPANFEAIWFPTDHLICERLVLPLFDPPSTQYTYAHTSETTDSLRTITHFREKKWCLKCGRETNHVEKHVFAHLAKEQNLLRYNCLYDGCASSGFPRRCAIEKHIAHVHKVLIKSQTCLPVFSKINLQQSAVLFSNRRFPAARRRS